MADLSAEEVIRLPEVSRWPDGCRVVDNVVAGTGEGVGFDGLDPSATVDRYFFGPYSFEEVTTWYRRHLAELGWSEPERVDAAYGTRWQRWLRGLESIDLIDRLIGPDHPLAAVPRSMRGPRLADELPRGWSGWSVTYHRRPEKGES